MRVPRFAFLASAGLLLSLAAGSVHADPPIVMDYNGDGVVSAQDGLDYAADKLNYNASTRPWADLNGDGVVNTDDDTIFYGTVRSNSFKVYWGISLYTNCSGSPYDPWDLGTTSLPPNLTAFLNRGVPGIGEWGLRGVLPIHRCTGGRISGVDLLLDDSFAIDSEGNTTSEPSQTYSNWETKLGDRLNSMFQATRAYALEYWGTTAAYSIGYIDIESIPPVWSGAVRVNGETACDYDGIADRWIACVTAINYDSFDEDFLGYIQAYYPGYEPPAGVDGLSDSYWELTEHQAEYDEFMQKSYNAFNFMMWQTIKDGIQAATWVDTGGGNYTYVPSPFENVAIGFYGWPTWYFWSDLGRPSPYADWSAVDVDDEAQPLLEMADILMPDLYIPRITCSTNPTTPCTPSITDPPNQALNVCGCKPYSDCQYSGQPNEYDIGTWMANVINEAKRVRSNCTNTSKPIIPFVWYHYGFLAGSCKGDNSHITLTTRDIHNEVYLPWVNGADGILLWGALSECTSAVCDTVYDPRGGLSYYMTTAGVTDCPAGVGSLMVQYGPWNDHLERVYQPKPTP